MGMRWEQLFTVCPGTVLTAMSRSGWRSPKGEKLGLAAPSSQEAAEEFPVTLGCCQAPGSFGALTLQLSWRA